MTTNAMPWSYTLLAGFAFAAFCGCSADGGSSSGLGTGGRAGTTNNATGGAGGSGNNVGGTGGNVSDYKPVSVTNSGNLYTLQMGRIKMVIDASVGARITEFSLDGSNVLTGPEVDVATHANYGSTFWPSPQNWSWPPATGAAVDTAAYTGSVDAPANSIQLVSGNTDIKSGATVLGSIAVTKKFVAVPDSGAVDVTYTIENVSATATYSVAPWQISRVAGTSGAITFYGQGTGTRTAPAAMQFIDQDGISWYNFVASPTADLKAKSDGAGWIAHVTSDKLLLLFEYPDIAANQAAPNEAEVEIYTGKNGNYIEVEPQGAYTAVPPGGTLEWTVRWKLRQIDASVEIAAGSATLEAFAQQSRNQ